MFKFNGLRLLSSTALVIGLSSSSVESMQHEKLLPGNLATMSRLDQGKAYVAAHKKLTEKAALGDSLAKRALESSGTDLRKAVEYYDAAGGQGASSGLYSGGHGGTGTSSGGGGALPTPEQLDEMGLKELKDVYQSALGVLGERPAADSSSWKRLEYVKAIEGLHLRMSAKGSGHGGAASSPAAVTASSGISSSSGVGGVPPVTPSEKEKIAQESLAGLSTYLKDEKTIRDKEVVVKFFQPIISVDVEGDWTLYKPLFQLINKELLNTLYDSKKQNAIGELLDIFETNPHLKKINFVQKFYANLGDPVKLLSEEGSIIYKSYPPSYKVVDFSINPLHILCYLDVTKITIPTGREAASFIKDFHHRSELLAALHYFYINNVREGSATGAELIFTQLLYQLQDKDTSAATAALPASIVHDFVAKMMVVIKKDIAELEKEVKGDANYKKLYDEFPASHPKVALDLRAHGKGNLVALYYMTMDEIARLSNQHMDAILSGVASLSSDEAKAVLYHLANIGFFTNIKSPQPSKVYIDLSDAANPKAALSAEELVRRDEALRKKKEESEKKEAEKKAMEKERVAKERKEAAAKFKAEAAAKKAAGSTTAAVSSPPPPPSPPISSSPSSASSPSSSSSAPVLAAAIPPGSEGAEVVRVLTEGGVSAVVAGEVGRKVNELAGATKQKKVKAALDILKAHGMIAKLTDEVKYATPLKSIIK